MLLKTCKRVKYLRTKKKNINKIKNSKHCISYPNYIVNCRLGFLKQRTFTCFTVSVGEESRHGLPGPASESLVSPQSRCWPGGGSHLKAHVRRRLVQTYVVSNRLLH